MTGVEGLTEQYRFRIRDDNRKVEIIIIIGIHVMLIKKRTFPPVSPQTRRPNDQFDQS